MKFLLAAFSVIFLFSCKKIDQDSTTKWKTIKVGDYLFDFPEDFTLKPEQGEDSYVGKIEGDGMEFFFDFGYYSSTLGETLEEYLTDGSWRIHLSFRFRKPEITYDQLNFPDVEVIAIRPATTQDSTLGGGCDYVAKCKYERTEFDHPVYIPHEIKEIKYKIDTVDNLYRKIVWSKDPKKEITGIYIRQLDQPDIGMNSDLALSMATSDLTIKQQEISLKIFSTVRHKNSVK